MFPILDGLIKVCRNQRGKEGRKIARKGGGDIRAISNGESLHLAHRGTLERDNGKL